MPEYGSNNPVKKDPYEIRYQQDPDFSDCERNYMIPGCDMLFREEISLNKSKHWHIEGTVREYRQIKGKIWSDMRIQNKQNSKCGKKHESLIGFLAGRGYVFKVMQQCPQSKSAKDTGDDRCTSDNQFYASS